MSARGDERPASHSAAAGAEAHAPLTLGDRVKRLWLVSLLILLTLNVWTGGPLLALWIGSRVQGSGPPSMGAIAVVAAALAVISVVLVKVLALVSARIDRLVGRQPRPREPAPWLRSMRGERDSTRDERLGLAVSDRILVLSVVLAVVAFEIWFFFFSGSPIGGGSGR